MTPLELRLLGYAGALALLLGLGWQVNHWRVKADQVGPLQTRLAAVLAAEETARTMRKEVLDERDKRLAALDTVRAATPVRTVRLYQPPPVPASGAASGRVDAATAGAGSGAACAGPSAAAGPDIGPQLYAQADTADTLTENYRALQAWARKITSK